MENSISDDDIAVTKFTSSIYITSEDVNIRGELRYTEDILAACY